MTFKTEFPDFPAADMPAIPAGWTDQSWHNDACPSFNTGSGMVVFIDFADPTLKEFEDTKRFTVHSDPEKADSNDVLFETDDWAEVLAFIATDPHAICAKWVKRIGGGFHPDTRGKDYTPRMTAEQIKEYDADMEALFKRAADPYECAVMAMVEAGHA